MDELHLSHGMSSAIDHRRFFWRQFEKVGRRTDPPAVRFEDLLFCLSHGYLPPRA